MFDWKELMNYRHFPGINPSVFSDTWPGIRAPYKVISGMVSFFKEKFPFHKNDCTKFTKLAHYQSMSNDRWQFQGLRMLLHPAKFTYPRKLCFLKIWEKQAKIAQICFSQSVFFEEFFTKFYH